MRTRMPRLSALAVLLLLPFAVAAQDFPKLKAGLWEMSNTMSNRPGQAMKSTVCLDASLQRDMIAMSTGMMQGMCSKHDLKVSGNKVTGDMICKMGESTMKSRSVMTMTGDTAYRTEAHTTFDPPFAGTTKSDTVIEGRYVGACRPGQRPGDMTMPTGQTINIRTIMSAGKM
jgi:Protein of unknown function (DUF3617)